MSNFYETMFNKTNMPLDEISMYIQATIPFYESFNKFLNLFHYTSSYVQNKIVNKDKINFRFSRLSDFLDTNEGFHILEPFYHALGTLYDDGKISDNFYETLKNINKNDIHKDTEHIWILCFSENGNSKHMKQRYAPKDGYIIGIKFDYLSQLCYELLENGYYIQILKVEYSNETITNNLINILKLLYSSYAYETETSPQLICNLNEKLKLIVVSILGQYGYFYKSSEYKKEQEIRIVFTAKNNLTERITKDEKEILYYDKDDKLHLNINRNALFYCEQDLSLYDDFRFNKTFIEIKSFFNKKKN